MKLSKTEKIYMNQCLLDIIKTEMAKTMQKYIHHGCTTTYKHCKRVAYYSYWLSLRLPFQFDERSLIRGAFLHDFYLYDWHNNDGTHRLHGFYHPGTALRNARKYFTLTRIEEDIIANHMWPMTITKIPASREAAIVCFIDKICSIYETLYQHPFLKKYLKKIALFLS
jgi:uncharacterized protein